MDKYIGKRLDRRYEIREKIGGGMASVYKAYDAVQEKIVAIKILPEENLSNQDLVRQFQNEYKVISSLDHNNIIKVFGFSFGDKIQYIVMEYLDVNLREYLDQVKEIKWKDALHFTEQILTALKYAHSKGIVHRDIKPDNIMLSPDGNIKVADFGIAKIFTKDTKTISDKSFGSVHYVSPEQAKGELSDEKSDIYSVGVMLYEMLTGKLPFQSNNAVSVALMQLQSNPLPARAINPQIPEGLEEIITKAMQKEPRNRYASANSMLDALMQFKENPSIKFEYKYFSSESENKYQAAIDSIKEKRGNTEDENNLEEENELKKKKAIKIIIGIGIGVLVFLVGFGLAKLFGWFQGGRDVDVPNFVGMKLSDVQNNSEYKFKFEITYAYDQNKPEDIILGQDPAAGSKKIKENATINLTVNSSGALVLVPSLKGLSENEAKTKLKELGLIAEIITIEDEETPAGIVKNTEPKDGTQVTVKSVVKVFISKGPSPQKVEVPNVIGKSHDEAINILTAAKLKISENIVYQSSSKAKNTVVNTSPLPGTSVNEGTAITLSLSSGEEQTKTLVVYVDLPKTVETEVSMKVYVDGAVDAENSKTIIPAYNPTYGLKISGSTGTKTVVVNLNNQKYRSYELNFDSQTVKTTYSGTFVQSTSYKTQAKIKK